MHERTGPFDLRLPPGAGGPRQPAASLLAYQNRLLRERCQRQHDKLLEFVSIARDNGRLAERVQRLALRLLNGRSRMEEFLRGVEAILRDEFKVDDVALCLAGAPVRGLFIDAVARISFLSCCVPLLAFAGLSVGGQLEELKKMSWKVILIFMIVSTCCFFGASLVAQLGFSIQGII